MSSGVSRRALAAAGVGMGMGAGLAVVGFGAEPAGAKGGRRPSGTVHVGASGNVRVERTRVTVPRVSHVARFDRDGAGEIVRDHRTLIPAPGRHIDYQLSGRTVAEDGDRGAFVSVQKAIRFRATGGSYDDATGQLILDGEVLGFTTDDEGRAGERDWIDYAAPFAPCLLELLLIIFMF